MSHHEMCTFESIFNLISDSASVVRVVGSSNIVLEGTAFTLTCEATGDPMPNVTWIKGSNNQRTHGNTLKFTKIDKNDAGDYKCEANNRCGMEARTEAVNVSCKYCIVSIWLWFMRKCIKSIVYHIMYYVFQKRERLSKKTNLNENVGKKIDLKTNLYKCVVNIFLVFFPLKL